jgi:2-amino-4-hydroxy-6-hydroxymethyldihydropteridine diphosphokinase
MNTVYLGLGSNLDDPENHLNSALEHIADIDQTTILSSSSFYKSPPLGPQDQPDFINCVVKLETELTAHILLETLQEIENQHGRKREIRWGPRTLDLDILLFGDMTINDDNLTIPHPQLAYRDFVLVPLNEIESDMIIPGMGPVSGLITRLETNSLQRIDVH